MTSILNEGSQNLPPTVSSLPKHPQDVVLHNQRLYSWDHKRRKIVFKQLRWWHDARLKHEMQHQQFASTWLRDPSAIRLPTRVVRWSESFGWQLNCVGSVPSTVGRKHLSHWYDAQLAANPELQAATNRISLYWWPSGDTCTQSNLKGSVVAFYRDLIEQGSRCLLIEPCHLQRDLSDVIRKVESCFERCRDKTKSLSRLVRGNPVAYYECNPREVNETTLLPAVLASREAGVALAYRDQDGKSWIYDMTGHLSEGWGSYGRTLAQLDSLKEFFTCGDLILMERPITRKDFSAEKKTSIYLYKGSFYYYQHGFESIGRIDVNHDAPKQLSHLLQVVLERQALWTAIPKILEEAHEDFPSIRFRLLNGHYQDEDGISWKADHPEPSTVTLCLEPLLPSDTICKVGWMGHDSRRTFETTYKPDELAFGLRRCAERVLQSQKKLIEDFEKKNYTLHGPGWVPTPKSLYPCFQTDRDGRLFLLTWDNVQQTVSRLTVPPSKLQQIEAQYKLILEHPDSFGIATSLNIPFGKWVRKRSPSLANFCTHGMDRWLISTDRMYFLEIEDDQLRVRGARVLDSAIRLKECVIEVLEQQAEIQQIVEKWSKSFETDPCLQPSRYKGDHCLPTCQEIIDSPSQFLYRPCSNMSVELFYLNSELQTLSHRAWISPDALPKLALTKLIDSGYLTTYVYQNLKSDLVDIPYSLTTKKVRKNQIKIRFEKNQRVFKISYLDPTLVDEPLVEVKLPVEQWQRLCETVREIHTQRRSKITQRIREVAQWTKGLGKSPRGAGVLEELAERVAKADAWVGDLSLSMFDPHSKKQIKFSTPIDLECFKRAGIAIEHWEKSYDTFLSFVDNYKYILLTPSQHNLDTEVPDRYFFEEGRERKAVVRLLPRDCKIAFSFYLPNRQVLHLETDPSQAITHDRLIDLLHEGMRCVELTREMQINPKRFVQSCRLEEQRIHDLPQGVDLNFLLEWFDDGNWLDASQPDYMNPKGLTDDGKPVSKEQIRKGLARYVNGIINKKKMWLLPAGEHFQTLELMAKHIVVAGMEDPSTRLEIAVRLGEIGRHCGARLMNGTRQEYLIRSGQMEDQASSGLGEALDRMILPAIIGSVEALIAGISLSHGAHWVYHCLIDQGIPLPVSIRADYQDELVSKVISDDPAEVTKYFLDTYQTVFTNMVYDQLNRQIQKAPQIILEIQESLISYVESSTHLSKRQEASLQELETKHCGRRVALEAELETAESALTSLEKELGDRIDSLNGLGEELEELRCIRSPTEAHLLRKKTLESHKQLQAYTQLQTEIKQLKEAMESNDAQFAGEKSAFFGKIVEREKFLTSNEEYTEFKLSRPGAYAIATVLGFLYKTK